MGIVKNIADHFRSAPKAKPDDHYGLLSPLLATGDYIASVKQLYSLFKDSIYVDFMSGKIKPVNASVEKAVMAYKDYVKGLPSHEQSLEKAQPFSTLILALESISGNIHQIEDHFQELFGSIKLEEPNTNLRSSSLVVIGYLEKADLFSTWLSLLIEHMTAETGDLIPPFRTKELMDKTPESAEFATLNLHRWNYKLEPLLKEIKEMQHKGSDLALMAEGGSWIDDFAHDSQFTPTEQDLMTASLRSPMMMFVTGGFVLIQDRIELLSTRKDWLTSKLILEQSKLRGMDPDSPEYKRLKKATEHYSNLVSKYEQKIERMRG